MAAHVAEPFEVAVLAPAPCLVVAPSIALPALHVTVEATVDEHCSCPVKETVNELLLFFMGTTEPPEVSGVSAAELQRCQGYLLIYTLPVLSRLWRLPANSCLALNRSYRPFILLSCPEPAKEATSELFLSITPEDMACELPDYPSPATGAIQNFHPVCHYHGYLK